MSCNIDVCARSRNQYQSRSAIHIFCPRRGEHARIRRWASKSRITETGNSRACERLSSNQERGCQKSGERRLRKPTSTARRSFHGTWTASRSPRAEKAKRPRQQKRGRAVHGACSESVGERGGTMQKSGSKRRGVDAAAEQMQRTALAASGAGSRAPSGVGSATDGIVPPWHKRTLTSGPGAVPRY